MSEQVIVRGPGDGRTVLVGGSDRVTYKARSAETSHSYFCFEVSTAPGFSPPLHGHAYRELFYVLDGEYEFTIAADGGLETRRGGPGTFIAIPPDVPHTFKNPTEAPTRMLIVHQPAALEDFFEEFGVPADAGGEIPEDVGHPDPAAIVAALERHGVHVLPQPDTVG